MLEVKQAGRKDFSITKQTGMELGKIKRLGKMLKLFFPILIRTVIKSEYIIIRLDNRGQLLIYIMSETLHNIIIPILTGVGIINEFTGNISKTGIRIP